MPKLAWGRKRGPIVLLIPVLTYTAAFIVWYAAGPGSAEGLATFEQRAGPLALAIVTFWWASGMPNAEQGSRTVLFVEHAVFVLGVNFVAQSLVNYLFATPVLPLPALIGGTVAGSMLIAMEYGSAVANARRLSRALLIAPPGDQTNRYMYASVQPLWGDAPAVNAEAIATAAVDRIVLREKDWRRIPAEALIRRKSAGTEVEDAKTEYERRNRRVSIEMMAPADLVFDPAFRSGRHVMAVQAIYTDLVGLVLLVLSSPLLLISAIAVALFGGAGPVIESVRCTGFQYVPFSLLRFRTQDRKTGRSTLAGSLLRRLHLANLPQLLNVVRGEMVLFGPRPVREEFAAALMELIPFFAHVFTLKPGLMGWAEVNTPSESLLEELERLEYAFYYIKYGSLALDVEILARTFRVNRSAFGGGQ